MEKLVLKQVFFCCQYLSYCVIIIGMVLVSTSLMVQVYWKTCFIAVMNVINLEGKTHVCSLSSKVENLMLLAVTAECGITFPGFVPQLDIQMK